VEKHQSNPGKLSGKYEKLSKKKENDVKWSENVEKCQRERKLKK
jgi:hypothetical protein